MEYIPSELIEIIISKLNNDDLISFIQITDSAVLWSRIFEYHFGFIKDVTIDEYLRYLNIERLKEKWWDIPEINVCTINKLLDIQELRLVQKQIKIVPKEIGSLINLKYLYLNNNQIKEIPRELSLLSNLEKLDLENNQIKEIPKELGALCNLEILYLNNNQITEVPRELGLLSKLNILFLSDNQIKQTTPELYSLFNLEKSRCLIIINTLRMLDFNDISQLPKS